MGAVPATNVVARAHTSPTGEQERWRSARSHGRIRPLCQARLQGSRFARGWLLRVGILRHRLLDGEIAEAAALELIGGLVRPISAHTTLPSPSRCVPHDAAMALTTASPRPLVASGGVPAGEGIRVLSSRTSMRRKSKPLDRRVNLNWVRAWSTALDASSVR